MHYTCILPEGPGEDQKCPICHREVEDDGGVYPHLLDLGAPRARSPKTQAAEPSSVPAAPANLSTESLPSRVVFPAEAKPSDQEAQERGFPTAKE